MTVSLEAITARWPFAVVHLRRADGTFSVSVGAAAIFDAPGGFMLVDPGYIDPWNTSHRSHLVAAVVTEDGPDAFTFSGATWHGTVERYTGSAAQRAKVGEALELYPNAVKAQGRSLDEERTWLRQHLRSELEPSNDPPEESGA